MSEQTSPEARGEMDNGDGALSRRRMLLAGTALAASSLSGGAAVAQAQPTPPPRPAAPSGAKPNIIAIFGDDVGQTNISAYSFGLVGYRTPNIDRIAKEGMMFTDYYAENSCTAGRSSFLTGQTPKRTGLSKVGIPGATVGLQARDITIAQALKPLGYATGQFGKNHLGDRNEFLRPFMASTSSSAISTTSTPRKSPSAPTGRKAIWPTPAPTRRAGCCGAARVTATIRPSTRTGDASGSRPSRTPARSPGSAWRPLTTRPPRHAWITWAGNRGRAHPSSSG